MALALTIGCLIACIVIATLMSRPATVRSRERAESRRAAFVSAHPAHARTADVVAALRREGLSGDVIDRVLLSAREQDASPVDLWQWFETFGVHDLSRWPLHGEDATSRAALPAQSEGTAAAVAATDEPRHRATLPEVHEPGNYPGLLVPRRGRVRLGDNVRRDGGSDHSAA